MRSMETIKNTLKQKGLKSTAQRVMLLKSIEDAGHIDIDTLYQTMAQLVPSISLNTIYLNLEQLTKEGLISKVALNSQKNVYETVKHQHAHLVCTECGDVIDTDMDVGYLENIKVGAEKNGLLPSFVAVNIYGICKKCRQHI